MPCKLKTPLAFEVEDPCVLVDAQKATRYAQVERVDPLIVRWHGERIAFDPTTGRGIGTMRESLRVKLAPDDAVAAARAERARARDRAGVVAPAPAAPPVGDRRPVVGDLARLLDVIARLGGLEAAQKLAAERGAT